MEEEEPSMKYRPLYRPFDLHPNTWIQLIMESLVSHCWIDITGLYLHCLAWGWQQCQYSSATRAFSTYLCPQHSTHRHIVINLSKYWKALLVSFTVHTKIFSDISIQDMFHVKFCLFFLSVIFNLAIWRLLLINTKAV